MEKFKKKREKLLPTRINRKGLLVKVVFERDGYIEFI